MPPAALLAGQPWQTKAQFLFHTEHSVFVTNDKPLMAFKQLMTIDCENHTELLNSRAAQQFLQHFLYFDYNQQVIQHLQFFPVVNFARPSCYCSATEQYVVSRMRKRSSKWRAMVMRVLKDELLFNFLWQRSEYRAFTIQPRPCALRFPPLWRPQRSPPWGKVCVTTRLLKKCR